MSEKIKIEVSKEIIDKIQKQYESGMEAYRKLNIENIDQFINYILENFANSTSQFDKLSDQMKKMIENIDLENLNFENIFKNIAESSVKKKEEQAPSEEKKEENKEIIDSNINKKS